MKLNKKKIVTVAMVVCLIAILSVSSLAWFTDKDSVTNEFHVATSTGKPDDIFSVDVWEKVDTDGDGVADDKVAVGENPSGVSYENIYPSAQLVKEPVVENTGSYDQYIRVLVTVDAQWDALIGGDLTNALEGYDNTLWIAAGKTTEGDKVTYTYYLNKILKPDATETLFTHVVIPAELTQEDFAALENGMFTMDIVAQAVQADNTGNNAQEAFVLVNP